MIIKDKMVDDAIYFTETNTTASAGRHKALAFERKSRMTLPSLTTTLSESKIVFEPVERNLNEYAKYRIHPKPGEKFLPLSATVVQLDTLESDGRRVRSNSVTNLKKIREKMASQDKNRTTTGNIYDNEITEEWVPEIRNDIDTRKKKFENSDLSLLRKKKLSYRDVIGDL